MVSYYCRLDNSHSLETGHAYSNVYKMRTLLVSLTTTVSSPAMNRLYFILCFNAQYSCQEVYPTW